MTPDPWDDDRLEAAFVALAADHLTPQGLAASTIEAVRAKTRSRRHLPARRWFGAAAAGIGLVVVIGLLARPPADRSGDALAPLTVHGLPVITVEEAVGVRGSGFDDRELAVRGWFTSEPGGIVECPFTPDFPPPLDRPCDRSVDWLMQDPESLYSVAGEQTLSRAPREPAIDPDLQGVAQAWAPPPPIDGASSAMDVVLVGHFDDRRASACNADRQSVCLDRFVVDHVAWADGAALPLSVIRIDEPTERTPDDVQAALAAAAPDKPVLSMVALRGGEIGSVEPTINARRGSLVQSIVWRVQVLIDERAVTYLVDDGTGVVYRVELDGFANPVSIAPQPSGPILGAPFNALGLPVMTVEEAMAIRDAGVDDHALVVTGWIPAGSVRRCPIQLERSTSPLQSGCGQERDRLGPDAASVSDLDGYGTGTTNAIRSVRVSLGGVDQSWRQTDVMQVVFVGHFDDRRSPMCPGDERDACRDTFVVDQVVSVDDVDMPLSVVIESDQPPTMTVDDITTLVDGEAPGSPILSMVALRRGGIVAAEPGLAGERDPLAQAIVWRVQVLDLDHAVTYLIDDDSRSVMRLGSDGRAEPSPIPSTGGLGQHTYRATLDLLSLSGAALPLQITDASGYLVDARSASRAELDFFDRPITAEQIRIENLLPFADTTLIALWDTTCDFDMTMSLFSREAGNYFGDPRLVPTDLELRSRQTLCDGLTLRRGVVLSYEVSVSARDITATRSVEPLPTFWPPSNAMTIGTLTTAVGEGRPPVEVAVVDESANLTSMAEAHADGIPASIVPEEPGEVWLAIDPIDAHRVYVGWTGGVCDSHATVTVGRDVGTITIDGGPHTPCDLMAIGRAVVLTFDAPLAGPPSLLVSVMVDGTSESPG